MDLELEPGVVLVYGPNGQGKSNLLEALYLLAVAKSLRASADRELVRRQAAGETTHTQVAAVVQREGDRVRVQIDVQATPLAVSPDGNLSEDPQRRDPHALSVQKQVRVNGLPRRAAEMVGEVNAVLFSAHDLDLVYGAPPVRRRYLDILVSQLDQKYLRALRRYERVLSQRNHLLKLIRERRAQTDELDYWDDEIITEAQYVVARRAEAVRTLSGLADPLHRQLTEEAERLDLVYRPGLATSDERSEKAVADDLRRDLARHRQREIAQGFTLSGPHRDDLQVLVDGMDAGQYASRGQSRTVVVAMKLAEASYVMERRGEEPVLLLDDVLSELDATRRSHVLEMTRRYQQCFITATDVESIEGRFLSEMHRLRVTQGHVEPVNAPLSSSR